MVPETILSLWRANLSAHFSSCRSSLPCWPATEELTHARHRFFAFAGTQVANTPQTVAGSTSTNLPQGPAVPQLMFISLAFAFSLLVNAWVFFRVSGGLFNPAVSGQDLS